MIESARKRGCINAYSALAYLVYFKVTSFSRVTCVNRPYLSHLTLLTFSPVVPTLPSGFQRRKLQLYNSMSVMPASHVQLECKSPTLSAQ